MQTIFLHDRCALFKGSCGEIGSVLAPNSVDAIVTDPPSGIGFMGKGWDSDKGGRDSWIGWLSSMLVEGFKVLKPGGHIISWAIPRTSHWTATAIENAGFELRDVHHDALPPDDVIASFVDSLSPDQRDGFERVLALFGAPIAYQIFGTGFPKSMNLSKAIDEALGASALWPVLGRGTVVCQYLDRGEPCQGHGEENSQSGKTIHSLPTGTATEAAARAAGWGTALKPAVEHWIIGRKPLEGTYAANFMKHGTGAINIDVCRIGTDDTRAKSGPHDDGTGWNMGAGVVAGSACGRWPAHLSLQHADACAEGACVLCCPVRLLDDQSGSSTSAGGRIGKKAQSVVSIVPAGQYRKGDPGFGDTGGASRFYYVAKGSRAEKDEGLDHLPRSTAGEATDREEGSAGLGNPRAGAGRTGGARNTHPTVKSVALMRWLVRLVTPPGGLVLDMFAGSGTTGVAALAEGCDFVGVELDEEGKYIPIIEGRLRAALAKIPGTNEHTPA